MSTADCSISSIKSIFLTNLPKLSDLNCSYSRLVSLELRDLPLLTTLDCNNNSSLSKLELSNCPNISSLNSESSSVVSISFLSENNLNEFKIGDNPDLIYICCSEKNLNVVNYMIRYYNYLNVNVNTYCSFDPFSDFGIVEGHVKV